ncbi:hypothetical protein Hanom_Chr05g00438831 [Helianthus anomalus]
MRIFLFLILGVVMRILYFCLFVLLLINVRFAIIHRSQITLTCSLVLFTDLTSQTGLANHLGANYSMLIVHGVSRGQLRKVKSKTIQTT